MEWTHYQIGGAKKLPPHPPLCGPCSEEQENAERERQEREREESIRARREQRASIILGVLRDSGVNTREHGRLTIRDMDQSEMGRAPVKACLDFIQEAKASGPHDPVKGVYLFGPTGCGKTQLAVATMREILMDPDWSHEHVLFDNAAALMTEVQDTYSSDRSTMAVKERRSKVRVWVLDDLGTERPKEDPARVLYEILNARALAPTIITSNYPPDELENQHPVLARVVSRFGPNYFRTVAVKGRDRRFAA